MKAVRRMLTWNLVVAVLFSCLIVLAQYMPDRQGTIGVRLVAMLSGIVGLMFANQPILSLFPRREFGLLVLAPLVLVLMTGLIILSVRLTETFPGNTAHHQVEGIRH